MTEHEHARLVSMDGYENYVIEYVNGDVHRFPRFSEMQEPTLRLTVWKDGHIANVAENTDLEVLINWVHDEHPEAKHLQTWHDMPEFYAGDRSEDREALADKTPREDRMERREDLRCSYCPPHGGENSTSYGRHSAHGQKPRYKNRKGKS